MSTLADQDVAIFRARELARIHNKHKHWIELSAKEKAIWRAAYCRSVHIDYLTTTFTPHPKETAP